MLRLILATSLLLLTTGVAGQLTIRSGLLIHGQPAVLYCSIPNFNDVGYWRKNGNQETRCDNAGFCAPITNTPYSFYSNATGIYLTIQTLTNTEQNVWTCAHAGYSTTTFTIDYNTNVFVVPDIITVTGMERNVTMEDDATLLLDVETACMNPQPIISLGYENGSNSFTLPFEIQNSSTTPCPTGGSIYTRELVISSDILCASTILPHVLVTPEGLPEGYSGKQWVSSNYLTFPTCKDETTTQSDLITSTFTEITVSFPTSDQSIDELTTFQPITNTSSKPVAESVNSSEAEVELAVGISVCCFVLLIVIGYIMILVVKRQKEQNLLDSFSVEYNAGTFSPYTASSGNSGKDYDVDFDTIYKSSSVVKTSTSYPVELGVSVPSNVYDVDFDKSGQSGTYRTAQANNTFTGESDSIQSYSNYSLSDIEKVADDFSNKCDSGDEILFVLKV